MISMLTARTSEIDDFDEAISDIKSQIDFSSLKKYSGGVLFCQIEFVESGLIEAICDELPFDVIGMTTMASASNDGYGRYDLTLTVLTSDEVTFTADMSKCISKDNYADEVDKLYRDIRGSVNEDPALILTFAPYLRDVSGYELVEEMDKACGGLPMWGSITNDNDFDYEDAQTICNGRHLPNGVAMMFLTGPVDPKFVVTSIPERNITGNRSIITKSDGATLIEINDKPVLEYMSDIGLVVTNETITTTPFMIYYDNSDDYVVLGFFTLFEDGSILTGGKVPEGTPISIGVIDEEGIFDSAKQGLDKILAHQNRQGTLLLPCVTRYIMLAPNQEGELELITKTLEESGLPFIMGYSGGEICPMPGPDGKLHNRYHNYTFCACIL